MKFKTAALCAIILIFFYSCGNLFHPQSIAEDALALTVEKNLKTNVFNTSGVFGISSEKSRIFVLPINQDVIDAAVSHKQNKEGLSESQKVLYGQNSYNKFINSDTTTFLIWMRNKNLNSDERVTLNPIFEHVFLFVEENSYLPLVDCSPNLKLPLNSGWNNGFLYFKGRIPKRMNSYSIAIRPIKYWSGSSSDSLFCTFNFDLTKTNYSNLLRGGSNKNEIEKKFWIKPCIELGIDEQEFTSMLSDLDRAVSNL